MIEVPINIGAHYLISNSITFLNNTYLKNVFIKLLMILIKLLEWMMQNQVIFARNAFWIY